MHSFTCMHSFLRHSSLVIPSSFLFYPRSTKLSWYTYILFLFTSRSNRLHKRLAYGIYWGRNVEAVPLTTQRKQWRKFRCYANQLHRSAGGTSNYNLLSLYNHRPNWTHNSLIKIRETQIILGRNSLDSSLFVCTCRRGPVWGLLTLESRKEGQLTWTLVIKKYLITWCEEEKKETKTEEKRK